MHKARTLSCGGCLTLRRAVLWLLAELALLGVLQHALLGLLHALHQLLAALGRAGQGGPSRLPQPGAQLLPAVQLAQLVLAQPVRPLLLLLLLLLLLGLKVLAHAHCPAAGPEPCLSCCQVLVPTGIRSSARSGLTGAHQDRPAQVQMPGLSAVCLSRSRPSGAQTCSFGSSRAGGADADATGAMSSCRCPVSAARCSAAPGPARPSACAGPASRAATAQAAASSLSSALMLAGDMRAVLTLVCQGGQGMP